METKGIDVRWPHQINFKQDNQRGDKKLVTPLATKQKGCASTNGGDEDLNKRH